MKKKLEVEPSGGPVRLQITRKEGVKAFLLAELGQVQTMEKA